MSDEEAEVISPSPPQSPVRAANPPSGEVTAGPNLRPVNVLLQRLLDVNPAVTSPSADEMDPDTENEDTVSGEDNSDVEIISLRGEDVEVVDMDVTGPGDVQQVRPPSRPSTPLPPADPSVIDPPTIEIASSPEAPAQQGENEREVPVSPSVRNAAVPIPSPARAVINTRNSQTDFRSPKRRKLSSPAKLLPTDEEEDDDTDSCPICFEPWTNSGSHRLASLRCGHLFGQSCIEKWLRGQGGKCPHCNAKAKRLDIRVIYAKSIKTLDTTERDRALKEAEHEKSLRMKAELATAQARLHYQLAVEECNRLKGELDRCQRQLSDYRKNPQLSTGSSSQSSQGCRGQFKTGRVLKILETGGCRVLSFSPAHITLAISQPSQSQLFPGFGIKKLNAMDFKTTQFVTMHSKPIRDLSFHPESGDGFLLSASMDKTVKLTNLTSNAVIQTYDTPMPVWSCVWNADDRNYFYAGQQNGTVLEFDIRNTQEHVQQLNTEGTRAPVVSLQYVPLDIQATFRQGGLLVGQLDRVTFYERKTGDYKLHLLPADGNLTSLHFEPRTRHILTSFRPTAKHPTVRHVMSEMTCADISTDPSDPEMLCSSNAVQTFQGGRSQKALSKTCLVPCPSDPSKVLVCSGDEATSMVHVWDSSDGRLVQKLAGGGSVVDICPVEVNSLHYLATLTEKSLSIHQWV